MPGAAAYLVSYAPQPPIHTNWGFVLHLLQCMASRCQTSNPTGHPTCSALCRRERARAVTTVFGGLDVGSAVGLLLCGPLIRWFGWQSVFYLFAVLGLVWCLAWPLFKPDKQEGGEASGLAFVDGGAMHQTCTACAIYCCNASQGRHFVTD
jgi:predicted MFS family arabinose efflux permease